LGGTTKAGRTLGRRKLETPQRWMGVGTGALEKIVYLFMHSILRIDELGEELAYVILFSFI
jgi:hypothetical protein